MIHKVFEIGSEYDWDSNQDFLLKEQWDIFAPYDKVKFLRSGRDAIRYLARMLNGKSVLMPALCCSCMPGGFEEEGYTVIYYKVKKDYSVDMEDVRKKIRTGCLFLFMNYFGELAITDSDLEELHDEGIITIEDITHDFIKRIGGELRADYSVCSIRKWFAIPDGGVVIGNLSDIIVENDAYFSELRKDGMKEKSQYLKDGLPEQKQYFRNKFCQANDFIDDVHTLVNMQEESIEILKHLNLMDLYEKRKINVRVLDSQIRNLYGIHTIAKHPENSTLYYPIIVNSDNPSEIQKALSKKGIYCPVIWPLPEKAKNICEVADFTSSHMLAIPCDHRYGVEDMEMILQILNDLLNKNSLYGEMV